MQPIRLGRTTIHKVHEMDSPVPLLSQLPGVTRDDLAQLARWYHAPDEITGDPQTSCMTFSVHSFVIELDGLTVLVDTCDGNHKNRSLAAVHQLDRPYLANLAAAGFAPEDIALVMCAHLHFDHVGWNTRLDNGRWVPTFTNARYVFGRRDYEYFSQNPPGEALHFEAFQDSILPVMDAGRGELVEEDFVAHREIGDGIWLAPAFGHSPGCCTINAQADGAGAVLGRCDPPPGAAHPLRPAIRRRYGCPRREPGAPRDLRTGGGQGDLVLPGPFPPDFGRPR